MKGVRAEKSRKTTRLEAHTGFEPAMTYLEGRCVTVTRMRRIDHPKLTMAVTTWLQTLCGDKFILRIERRPTNRGRGLLEWLG